VSLPGFFKLGHQMHLSDPRDILDSTTSLPTNIVQFLTPPILYALDPSPPPLLPTEHIFFLRKRLLFSYVPISIFPNNVLLFLINYARDLFPSFNPLASLIFFGRPTEVLFMSLILVEFPSCSIPPRYFGLRSPVFLAIISSTFSSLVLFFFTPSPVFQSSVEVLNLC